MSRVASSTGLISARTQPVCRPKAKRVELLGYSKPAPFGLRPFAGLFNPYPYGCSVLCNHPADCEVKDVLRRAKDSWATEGKAVLSVEEMQIIRSNFLAIVGNERTSVSYDDVTCSRADGRITIEAMPLPEELFRKYTEADEVDAADPPAPAPTPTPTPASVRLPTPVVSKTSERTALVLDLRTDSFNQDNETFTWHALTLEPLPTPRKTEIISSSKLVSRQTLATPKANSRSEAVVSPSKPPSTRPGLSERNSAKDVDEEEDEEEEESDSDREAVIIRRRGKRLRKRKCRRGSTYGQQTEVRDPLEPAETLVSQIEDASRRASKQLGENGSLGMVEVTAEVSEKPTVPSPDASMLSSFIAPDILRHLCRQLDRDKVEAEFSIKRRIAFEEALRVKENGHPGSRGPVTRQTPTSVPQNIPRVFSRQAARFELLDSRSLCGLTPLGYLSKYVSITTGRKVIFARAFNRYVAENVCGKRYMLPTDVHDALQEVTGKPLTEEQKELFEKLIGEITEPLDFRTWCGIAAAVERLLCPLPQKEIDPPTWLERTDFETLHRKLNSIDVNPKLALLLKEISHR